MSIITSLKEKVSNSRNARNNAQDERLDTLDALIEDLFKMDNEMLHGSNGDKEKTADNS